MPAPTHNMKHDPKDIKTVILGAEKLALHVKSYLDDQLKVEGVTEEEARQVLKVVVGKMASLVFTKEESVEMIGMAEEWRSGKLMRYLNVKG